jgi:hypothetical protein
MKSLFSRRKKQQPAEPGYWGEAQDVGTMVDARPLMHVTFTDMTSASIGWGWSVSVENEPTWVASGVSDTYQQANRDAMKAARDYAKLNGKKAHRVALVLELV